MRLSKTSTQATLALAFLAQHGDQQIVHARLIAEHLGVPTDSALKVLQQLSRRGLIQSQLGRSGGYALHRPAASITLLEVVEAMEGPIEPLLSAIGAADHHNVTLDRLRKTCQQASDVLRKQLESLTVADLIAEPQPISSAA